MGWFKDYFDTDNKAGGHQEGDIYNSNIEYTPDGGYSSFGTFTLSIYRVRKGVQGKNPIHTEKREYYYGETKRTIERALERRSDEVVQALIAGEEVTNG